MPATSLRLSPEAEHFLMREALAEAERGVAAGEAPIGCVIARPDPDHPGRACVVARGHNKNNALQRKTAHAEIVAFENAGGREGDPAPPALPLDADDVILVSSLEPCVMCLGAAMEAGVKLVLFGLKAPADNGTTRVRPPESPESSAPEIRGGILAGESRRLFEQWLDKHKGTEQAKFVEQLLSLT